MADRQNTPFTNEHFAAYCLRMVGQPYWFGTCGYKATSSLLNRKAAQYPSSYTEGRMAQYKQNVKDKCVVCDCIGGAKGYAWTGGGQPILDAIGTDAPVTNQYGSNGCPDHGANGMFTYAKGKGLSWGAISTLPEIVGLALHKDGHVGYYVGGGYAVEWKGFAYGCVKTKVEGRGWTNWYMLPFIDYDANAVVPDTPIADNTENDIVLGSRQLEKGMTGTDVEALQELLIQLGYSLPKFGADGKFGAETRKAVIAFQKKCGLSQDGKYGVKTHAALMDAIGDADGQPDDPGVAEPPATAGKKVVIRSTSGKVNIRAGNGTKFARISSVANGAAFDYVATAENGWIAVVISGKVGWVSGNYASVT